MNVLSSDSLYYMKGGFAMYCFRIYELKKINIQSKLSERQGISLDTIHWLNPLLCNKKGMSE